MEWNSMEMSTTKCKSFNTYEHFLICKRRVNDLLNRSIEYRMQLLKRDSACRSIYDLTHFLAKKLGREIYSRNSVSYISVEDQRWCLVGASQGIKEEHPKTGHENDVRS